MHAGRSRGLALSWTEPYYVPATDPIRSMTAGWHTYLDLLCDDASAGFVSLPADKKDAA